MNNKGKRKPLIRLKDKSSKINTQYGKITYEDWCKKEVKRIGGGCFLIYSDNLVGVMDKKRKDPDENY